MADALRAAGLGDLQRELQVTRTVLERLPEEHYAWKPHAKSWSLGELGGHVANLLYWQRMTIEQDEFDMAASPPPAPAPKTRAELLARFDEQLAALRAVLDGADDAVLQQTWTLRHGSHTILSQPKAAVLRTFGLSHMIHHRGQLSVYLRLLDVPVPSVYGPSADEQGG